MAAPSESVGTVNTTSTTADPAALPSGSGSIGELHAEQVKLLYANAPVALISVIVGAPVLAAIQWTMISHETLLAWLAYMTLITGLRAVLVRAYRHAPPPSRDANRWWTGYLAGVALSGIGWGAAGFLLFPDASSVHQLFLIFVLGGMAVGAVTAYAAKIEAFLAFALPALLPLIVRLSIDGDAYNLARAGMVTLFAVLMVFIARKLHATILTSLNLRFDNQDLIRYLAASKSRIELLNTELTVDISERKRAEETIRESAKRIRAIFEQAPLGIAVIDSHTGQFIEINKKYCEIAGFSEEEMRCRTFQDITHPKDLQADLGNMKLLLEGTIESFEMDKRYIRKDDSTVWVHLTVVPLWWGAEPPRHHIAMVEDITERKRAEEALRESEMRFRSMIQSAFDAVIVADSRGRIMSWNTGALRIFGYREEEILGQPLTNLMPERYREAHEQGLARLRATGESRMAGKALELHGLRKHGSEFPLELTLAVWKKGEETFCSGIIRDITDRKQAEKEREKLLLQLQDAMAKINVLHGLLPICSYCKKIRDEHGSWHAVETYVRDHSDADFSHGICPDCVRRLPTDSGLK